jgi:hypothetical protein
MTRKHYREAHISYKEKKYALNKNSAKIRQSDHVR